MDGITMHRIYKVEDELMRRLKRRVYCSRYMDGSILTYKFHTDAGAHCAIDFDTMHKAAMAGGATAAHLFNQLAYDLDVYDRVILARYKLTLDDTEHVMQFHAAGIDRMAAMAIVGLTKELHRRLHMTVECEIARYERKLIVRAEHGHTLSLTAAEIEAPADCNNIGQWFMQWVDDLEKRITYEQTK